MKEYDIYLFDFDGTLVDSADSLYLVYKKAFNAVGMDLEREEVETYMKECIEKTFLRKSSDEVKLNIYRDIINSYINDDVVTYANKLYPDTKKLIDHLAKKHKKMGFVSGNDSEHMKKVLLHLGIDPNLFESYIGHGEVKIFKPDPEGMFKALKQLGFDKSKHSVCYVGDSINDMKAANNAGLDSIFVKRSHNKDDIHEGKFVINTLDELII